MKLSDLELTAYDLIAILLPGLFALGEIGVSINGLTTSWAWVSRVSITGSIIIIFVGFGLGHLISQAAYECATLFGKSRVLRRGRDASWQNCSLKICTKLMRDYCVEILPTDWNACDRAFNDCLTAIGSAFEKRRVFVLVSSLSLTLWFLCLTAPIAGLRAVYLSGGTVRRQCLSDIIIFIASAIGATLAWRRSLLYSDIADATVFDVFEASKPATLTERVEQKASI